MEWTREDEFPEVFDFCSVQTLENAVTEQAKHFPFTETEERKRKAGTTTEKIVLDRLWNKRPDGFAIKMPTDTKAGELVILEFKRMSCVTDQYVKLAKRVAEAQYASIKSTLEKTLGVLNKSCVFNKMILPPMNLECPLAYAHLDLRTNLRIPQDAPTTSISSTHRYRSQS